MAARAAAIVDAVPTALVSAEEGISRGAGRWMGCPPLRFYHSGITYKTSCVAPDLQDMVILYILLLVCPREHIIEEVWLGQGCDLFGT